MTSIALTTSQWSNAPKLQLVPKNDDTAAAACNKQAVRAAGYRQELSIPHDASTDDKSPVLVAGCDPVGRADVLDSLSEIMPKRTLFQEVETFWEVLVRAPAMRMVVLSGELDGIPTESLLHMLGRRYPELPVVSLDAPAPRDDARLQR